MAEIEVDGLVVRYGPVTAVDDVAFSVDAGEVVTLLGPNGAGKTSTVEALEGYRRPTAGRVRVLGLDPVAERDALVPRIGVMPQTGGVYPGIRCSEMLQLYAGFHAAPDEPGDLLERVGLAGHERKPWRTLSGGEQQRLSLALALVGRPRVVFLDEPTAGVDLTGRRLVRRLVRSLADDGVAVLLTTHDLAEAERVADRVVIIDRGRLVASGTAAELAVTDGARRIRFGGPHGIDVTTLGRQVGATIAEETNGEYRVDLEPTPANIALLTARLADAGIQLTDLRAGRHHLEDIFTALTGADGQDGDDGDS